MTALDGLHPAADVAPAAPTYVERPGRFDSLDPATGEVIGSFPQLGPADVAEAVERARRATTGWQALGFEGRRRCLDAWRGEIARNVGDLVRLVHRENGKPPGDATLEVTVALDHIAWSAANARAVLGPQRVRSGLLAANQTATVEYQPYGVVGVIGPWNYPVLTPIGSLTCALAAGNTVVHKPSEFTPAVGQWLVDAWNRAVPGASAVLQLITGDGRTGAALCRVGVDKVAFTGSSRTGRAVMAACAEDLIPVVMECGGKDAAIVLDDADVAAAADAILWGAMSNAGQTCLGIERVYATPGVHDWLLAELARQATGLTPGKQYGPMTMPSQTAVVRRHIDDAVARGGRVIGSGRIEGPWIWPVILADVPPDALAIREETFGPTVTVTKVADADEAIRLANATSYGLGSAVFTGPGPQGAEVARRIRSGMTSVNSIMSFASVPGLPLGGVGGSGFGRVHGPDGLREFATSKATTQQRFALPLALASFRRRASTDRLLTRIIRLRHGRHRPITTGELDLDGGERR